uniref:SFRICE_002835 n=1 Tax=Spodoptera frugiperda TaxID=7108 RepID=A0A2H1VEL9_SPOFR
MSVARVRLPVDLAKMNVGVKFVTQQRRNAVPLTVLKLFMRIKMRGRRFLPSSYAAKLSVETDLIAELDVTVMRATIMRYCVDKSKLTSETDNQIKLIVVVNSVRIGNGETLVNPADFERRAPRCHLRKRFTYDPIRKLSQHRELTRTVN